METVYDSETGYTTATLKYKNLTFSGEARCHPKDRPSEFAGTGIAETRALMSYLRFVRDHEIKCGLAALKQLYYSMKHSKNFNPKSYEAKMLYRQIRQKEDDLDAIKENLQTFKNLEHLYMDHSQKVHELVDKKEKDQGN